MSDESTQRPAGDEPPPDASAGGEAPAEEAAEEVPADGGADRGDDAQEASGQEQEHSGAEAEHEHDVARQVSAADELQAELEAETEAEVETESGDADGADGADAARDAPASPSGRRFTPTTAVVVVLMVLLGFTATVVVRNVAEDPTSAALGEEDLVRILANLDAHEERLRQEIVDLRETRRRLTTEGESQQEALAEAERRADELGVLAGTLPVQGPGVVVRMRGGPEAVTAQRMLDAVQELRAAGAEAIQVEASDGTRVRVVASTSFVAHDAGIVVDGALLSGPWTLTVVGEPETLEPALQIPGGVVESVQRDGGTVTVHEEPGGVEVSAVRDGVGLDDARPGS